MDEVKLIGLDFGTTTSSAVIATAKLLHNRVSGRTELSLWFSHGQPTRIDIAVAYDGPNVSVTVSDNGCGFAPNDAAAARAGEPHFGLDTMRERVEKIGGRLRIESTSGERTTVHAVARVTSRWL